jgi:hypothetical protein
MADLTFKGTTQQVLLEIGKGASSKIDTNTGKIIDTKTSGGKFKGVAEYKDDRR